MNTTTAPHSPTNQNRPATQSQPATMPQQSAVTRSSAAASPNAPDLHSDQETRISPTADRGVLGDVMGFRPSSTLGRELFAITMNVLIIGAFAIVFQPPLAVCLIAGVILLARLAAGFATEGYAAQLKGEN